MSCCWRGTHATGDNFTFYPLVNDSNRTLGHTRFDQHLKAHMLGDETWGMFEIVLFLAGAICIFAASALAVPDWSLAIQ